MYSLSAVHWCASITGDEANLSNLKLDHKRVKKHLTAPYSGIAQSLKTASLSLHAFGVTSNNHAARYVKCKCPPTQLDLAYNAVEIFVKRRQRDVKQA